ncbi:MAG: GNAT family N-acetyltransferase [Pseudarcicella sp.]|nr:GNAT family N-acetyltransferase [Pseudarcicella sp.]MBP6411226.1 GNAT family N-acetyltransferase [Pseudarcicella sp.]
MIEICTKRLKLVPLDNFLLSIWANEGRQAMEDRMSLSHSSWLKDPEFYEDSIKGLNDFWLPQTNENFIDFFWYTNWEVIFIEKNISIGGLGFSGFPNLKGESSIGYFIQKEFRNQGFASEALNGIVSWAKIEPALKLLIAQTEFFNLPSQSVLRNAGFKQTELNKTNMKYKYWELAF